MAMPLYEAILKHNKKGMANFHMPGHKGSAEVLGMLRGSLAYDITELPDSGSLFDRTGPVEEAQQLATQAFGTAGTFFSAGGSTLCIQAMLRLALPQGGKLILSRLVHRSVANAMALLDIQPVWVMPDESAGPSFPGRMSPDNLEEACRQHPDARAVYVTSPDYFGVLCDSKALSETAARYAMPLLVDAAHGAHLYHYNPTLDPIQNGASLCAVSAHKTLPVLTGGAMLHVGDTPFAKNGSYAGRAAEAMALFGSTSPSFLTLLSLDVCRAWLEETGGAPLRHLAQHLVPIKSSLRMQGVPMPHGYNDPLRIAFDSQLPGNTAGDILRAADVEPEYASGGLVILLPSCANSMQELTVLTKALGKLRQQREKQAFLANSNPPLVTQPQIVLTPKEALLAKTQQVEVSAALGKTAAQAICPCPPAIPLVMPGERVGEEAVVALRAAGIKKLEVVI